jgi:hypothetical protein
MGPGMAEGAMLAVLLFLATSSTRPVAAGNYHRFHHRIIELTMGVITAR